MDFDTTFSNLKKRIFELLDEFSSDSDTVFLADGDRQLLESKLPDAVNSALLQMYESLPIGGAKAEQRLRHTRAVFYDKGFSDDTQSHAEIYLADTFPVFHFRYFGSGNLIITDENGEEVYSISCDGSESMGEMRVLVPFSCEGLYRVYAASGLFVKDFSVYESDGSTNAGYFGGRGKASFGLPENFGRILCITGNDGAIDKNLVEISDGFAYLPENVCAGLDSVTVYYKKCAKTVSTETPDSFVLDLMPLEFEALVCLAASFMCREQDAGKHTVLVYRYNDICEGIRSGACTEKYRNSFYKYKRKMGW